MGVCCDAGKTVLHDLFWSAKPPPQEVLEAMELVLEVLFAVTGKIGLLALLQSPDRHGLTPLEYIKPSQQTNWKLLVDKIVSWTSGAVRPKRPLQPMPGSGERAEPAVEEPNGHTQNS